MDAIFQRTSVRSYSKKPVKKKAIKKLLKAAMQAPSAGNQQPWEFIVVTDSDLITKLSACSPYAKPVAKAPVSIVMLMRTGGLRFGEMAQQDMGACAENMLLEATELGLGSVWQGLYPVQERMGYVSELFDVPEGLAPFAIVSLGYPKKGKLPDQKSRYDKKRISWNRYVPASRAQNETELPSNDSNLTSTQEKRTDSPQPTAVESNTQPLAGWRSASNASQQ